MANTNDAKQAHEAKQAEDAKQAHEASDAKQAHEVTYYNLVFPALPAEIQNATYNFTKSDFYTTQGYKEIKAVHLGDFVKIRRIVGDTKREAFVYVRAIMVDPASGEQIPYVHLVGKDGKLSHEAKALRMSTIDSLYSRANRGNSKRAKQDEMLDESDLFA